MGMRPIRILLLATNIAFAIPSVGSTQELRPLRDLVAAGTEETYPLVRCAAFYLSMLEWAGEDRIGKDATQRVKVAVAGLAGAASEMRATKNGSSAADTEGGVFEDIRAISDLYLSRYRTNYAVEGKAWENDTLWDSDSTLCKKLAGG